MWKNNKHPYQDLAILVLYIHSKWLCKKRDNSNKNSRYKVIHLLKLDDCCIKYCLWYVLKIFYYKIYQNKQISKYTDIHIQCSVKHNPSTGNTCKNRITEYFVWSIFTDILIMWISIYIVTLSYEYQMILIFQYHMNINWYHMNINW